MSKYDIVNEVFDAIGEIAKKSDFISAGLKDQDVYALCKQGYLDMFNTYNMGVGMCVTVAKEDADTALAILRANGEDAYVVGEVIEGDGVVIE